MTLLPPGVEEVPEWIDEGISCEVATPVPRRIKERG
jgi:hypothetical protein